MRAFNIVRAFQVMRHVFVQVHQDIDNDAAEWITTDFSDSDATGKIIEH